MLPLLALGLEGGPELISILLIGKGLRNLVLGEDDELKAAYANLGKMLDQEKKAVATATLVGVEQAKAGIEELKKEGKGTHEGVKEGLEIGGRIEENTAFIASEMAKLRLESERRDKLWHGELPSFESIIYTNLVPV